MVDNRQFFYNKLTGELGLPPQAALGALYSLGGESHYDLDTTAVGKGGDFGVAQWTGSRKAGLNQMAKTLGTSNTDPETQWQFMKSELLGPYSHVLQGLHNTNTAADATNIWTSQYEVPAVNNWQQRYKGGSSVGSLDANNQFVPGSATAPANPAPSVPGTSINTTTPAVAPAAPAAQPSVASLLGQGNFQGAMGAFAANPDLMKSMQGLGGVLGGGDQQQQRMAAPPLPPPPNLQDNSAAISQMAPQLLAALMAKQGQLNTLQRRPQIPGMTLGGFGG